MPHPKTPAPIHHGQSSSAEESVDKSPRDLNVLSVGWGQGVKVEEGAGALLTFFIYVLRFQDTWKGFAPFLLIGYRPQGSLLIYVPNKSPRQAVSLLYWGLSPHLDESLGGRTQSRNVGEMGSPGDGHGLH